MLTEADIYICDFHREQAWLRWTSATANRVKDEQETVLCLLHEIAQSNSRDDYEKAVGKLESSKICSNSEKLHKWFTRTWLQRHEVNGI